MARDTSSRTRLRNYCELHSLSNFEQRYQYLVLRGVVGQATFGYDRYLNQNFYRSREWKSVRDEVIVRDNGCDLGIEGFEIHDRIYIHHMNPMTVESVIDGDPSLLDPEYLICVTHQTHNAIHYGDERRLPRQWVERKSGDTRLW